MDANEYACKVKPGSRSLGVLLNKVQWLGKGKGPTVAVMDEIETVSAKEAPQAAKEKKPDSSLASEPVPETETPSVIDESVKINGDDITIMRGDRKYRIRQFPHVRLLTLYTPLLFRYLKGYF